MSAALEVSPRKYCRYLDEKPFQRFASSLKGRLYSVKLVNSTCNYINGKLKKELNLWKARA
jgi:hypothetical protein